MLNYILTLFPYMFGFDINYKLLVTDYNKQVIKQKTYILVSVLIPLNQNSKITGHFRVFLLTLSPLLESSPVGSQVANRDNLTQKKAFMAKQHVYPSMAKPQSNHRFYQLVIDHSKTNYKSTIPTWSKAQNEMLVATQLQ